MCQGQAGSYFGPNQNNSNSSDFGGNMTWTFLGEIHLNTVLRLM